MDISAALAADLAVLTEALDVPDIDLQTQLHALSVNVRLAVASYVGVTIAFDGQDVVLTAHGEAAFTPGIATSLLIPLSTVSTGLAGGTLVLYAAAPGAFVDLAADLSYALGVDPAALVLDEHLVEPADVLGRSGLEALSTINQAIGVLIERGRTPESAREELERLAALDSGNLLHVVEQVLHSTVRRPANDDT